MAKDEIKGYKTPIPPQRSKKQCFDDWFQDDHILLHLDAREEGVIVPSHLKDQHSLTLKLSPLFQGETVADDIGISTYLKFNGQYSQCIIPWTTLWGMTSEGGQQEIWRKDLPREVFHDIARATLSSIGSKLLGKLPGRKNHPTSSEQKSSSKLSTINPSRILREVELEKTKIDTSDTYSNVGNPQTEAKIKNDSNETEVDNSNSVIKEHEADQNNEERKRPSPSLTRIK